MKSVVLHHYKLTRFSNDNGTFKGWVGFYTITNLQGSQTVIKHPWKNLRFYTITNLQGSQTLMQMDEHKKVFYTITNLQGSQTSNEIITEPNILVNIRKLPSNV